MVNDTLIELKEKHEKLERSYDQIESEVWEYPESVKDEWYEYSHFDQDIYCSSCGKCKAGYISEGLHVCSSCGYMWDEWD